MSDSENQVTFRAPILEEVEALFPSYDVIGLIACGGMGAVYHATQRSLDRPVAIKLLPREFSTDEAFRTGFEAEAKAMAKLNHPNLIGVYDFGEVDGMLYIVMEFVDGNSLFAAANGQPIDQTAAISIISNVCHGLANAHENGILHRDIKPANILLDANLNPKVSDFGLARSLETQIQEGEQIFGTPGYTAPEVLEPPHSFDHRADIFSVGVMLYELLTGTLPDSSSPPASQVCSCNIRLDRVIQRAMHQDPESRYHSATELAADLQNIGSSSAKALVTSGSSPSGTYTSPKLKSKSSTGLGMTLLLLALLGGAGYAYYHFKIKPTAQPEQTADLPDPAPVSKVIEINREEKIAPPVEPAAPETLKEAPEESAPKETSPGEKKNRKKPAPPSAEPKYNVKGLFERATKVMSDRLQPGIQLYNGSIANNYQKFISDLERETKGMSNVGQQELATQVIADNKADWNGRIPPALPKRLTRFEKLTEIHDEYYPRQIGSDEYFLEELSEQAEFYIDGLRTQIGKLKDADDQGAIDLIQREIDAVNDDLTYFARKFMTSPPVVTTEEN